MKVTAEASAAKTQTPSELSVLNGLTLGRVDARQVTAKSGVSHSSSAVTTETFGYSFIDDRIAGGFRSLTHTATQAMAQVIAESA